MANRVQVHLPQNHEGLFDELRSLAHAQWPVARDRSPRRDKTTWVRIAIRALFVHAQLPAGCEWIFVKSQTQKISRGPAVREPHEVSATKVDISLDVADRARVIALIEAGVAGSEAGVVRTALAHLREIAARLRSGHELLQRQVGDEAPKHVDLAALALGEGPALDQQFIIPLRASRTPRPAAEQPAYGNKSSPPHYSSRTDDLFAVLFFTTSFNRWLVIKVAEITQRAYLKGTLSKEQTAQQEAKYRLSALLELFMAEGAELLRVEFSTHKLIPSDWRRNASYERSLEIGYETMASYLKTRFDIDTSWSRLRWRDWTRSHDTVEAGREHRECAAPLDWTAVAHHRLVHYHATHPSMVAHELQTWLVDAFGVRNRKHLEVLVAACGRFNVAFYGSAAAYANGSIEENEKRLSLMALLEILQEPSLRGDYDTPETDKQMNWPRAAYLLLHIARVIVPVYLWRRYEVPTFAQVEPRIRSLTYADVAEVRARLFGAQTGIQGLHWILYGGIVPRTDLGRVWLIHGNPGAGKSTFSVHLAADMARRGRTCIVLCAEERAGSIRERLLMFGLLDPGRYDVVDREQFEALLAAGEQPSAVQTRDEPVKGLLVVMAATSTEPTLELSSWLRATSERVRRLREHFGTARRRETREQAERRQQLQRRWRWLSVVVDSIDALEIDAPSALTGSGPAPSERVSMANLVRTIEVSGFWGILVCGAHNPATQALSYLADTVIELSVDASGLHRRLQILKCRMQPYDPGAHVLQLVDGTGAVVDPNLTAFQRHARRRARPRLDADHRVPIPKHIYWRFEEREEQPHPAGEMEGGARKVGDEADSQRQEPSRVARRVPSQPPSELPSLRRGSAVLLHGPPQSGKMPFLLNLLAQRPQLTAYPNWPLGSLGTVLIVSFRGSEQDYLRPLKESKLLGDRWRESVGDLRIVSYGADETMRGAQIVHELVRRIQRLRRDSLPLDWIAFVGVEALHANLPGVANEQSFWPTVLSVTASEAISTVFMAIDTEAQGGFASKYGREMDYVFKFGRRGNDRTVETEKSPDPPTGKDYPRLVFDPQQGPVRAE